MAAAGCAGAGNSGSGCPLSVAVACVCDGAVKSQVSQGVMRTMEWIKEGEMSFGGRRW